MVTPKSARDDDSVDGCLGEMRGSGGVRERLTVELDD